jgi:hypothetical protein
LPRRQDGFRRLNPRALWRLALCRHGRYLPLKLFGVRQIASTHPLAHWIREYLLGDPSMPGMIASAAPAGDVLSKEERRRQVREL